MDQRRHSAGRAARRLAVAGWVILGLLGGRVAHGDAGDTMVQYLRQYHDLAAGDVEGRMQLADWCAAKRLVAQQLGLLEEVLKLRPDHREAYRDLIALDGQLARPVSQEWADKLQGLLGASFRLQHGPHFTLLTDADEESAQRHTEALEALYRQFYRDVSGIGLRPMPPKGRLVCVLFEKHADYVDFLKRFEGMDASWAAGCYSIRTNRVIFFNDRDNPAFAEVRQQIQAADDRIEELREAMRKADTTAQRLVLQEQLKRQVAGRGEMNSRLTTVAGRVTAGKIRHEATHQLFYNCGLQRREDPWPFWVNEGLATTFEAISPSGQAGPACVNASRLKTYRELGKERPPMGIEQLLAYVPSVDGDGTGVPEAYAQVWALMYFLWNRHPEQLRAMIEEVSAASARRDWPATFTKHFGDVAAVEREWRRYVDSLDGRG